VTPSELRAVMAADYRPVAPLRSPWLRAAFVTPLAIIALLAAPVAFHVRADAQRLGWLALWGASVLQAVIGVLVIAAALRESVPGRSWSRAAVALWLTMPVAVVLAVTAVSWQVSPAQLRGNWWQFAAVCFSGSASTALPIVALASVLAVRAFPTRPALAGAMIGLGAGLIADGGWRLFCSVSEPGHVLSTHLAAVVMCGAIGALLAPSLAACRTRAR